MSNDIDPELLKAFEQLITPVVKIETEYRAYYDITGKIVSVSPEPINSVKPENCLVVSKEVYEKSHRYIIIDDTVIPKFAEDLGIKPALVKSNKGFKVVKNNPALLIEKDEDYPNVEHYEYRIN